MIKRPVVTAVLFALHLMGFQSPSGATLARFSVFRSLDGGRTWLRSNGGLPSNERVNAFGKIGGVVLAGTDRGIYLSRDRGNSWKPGSGAARGSGRIVAFSTIGSSVVAATDRSGVLVSFDSGANWTVDAGFPTHNVRALLAFDGGLYAGTDGKGVFVSRNGGASWAPMSRGLPGGTQIFSLAASRGTIFAGLYSKGLYAWSGLEASWRKVGEVLPLALATTGGSLLAGHNPGGILRSDDAGVTWTTGAITFSEGLGKAPVWELSAGANLAVAGVSSAIYHSEDRGRTWVEGKTGLPRGSSGVSFLVDNDFVLAGVIIQQPR
jgi:hypothetical protein